MAGFIEAWGRGFKKIREGFEAAHMQLPVYEDHCGGMLVTIYRKNPVLDTISTPLVPHQDPISTPSVFRLVSHMSADYLSLKKLMQLLDLKDVKSFRQTYLNPAIQEGLVEKEFQSNHPKQRFRLTQKGLEIKNTKAI